MSTQPMSELPTTKSLVYVIGPLAAVFAIGSFACLYWYRRKRRNNPTDYAWPRERLVAPDGSLMFYPRGRRNGPGRWNFWGGMRSDEGLNELGEAPPPYDTKRRTATNGESAEDDTGGNRATGDEEARIGIPTNAHLGPIQLRDMENGAQPPAYVDARNQSTIPPPVAAPVAAAPAAPTAESRRR